MLPVRVSLAVHGKSLVDNYVVVDDSVKLCDLIGTALTHLGCGHLVDNAQGFIQVGTWKPLTFEQIFEDHDQPAIELLKPIAYDAVLKVVVRPNQLGVYSHAEPTTTPTAPKKTDERVNVTDPRLSDSDTVDGDSEYGVTESSVSCKETLDDEPSPKLASELLVTLEEMLQQFLQHQGPLFDVAASSTSSIGHYEPKMSRSPSPKHRRYSPMTGPVKPCFDTIYEVPMLQAWYVVHKFPGKAQCQQYADELNALSHRQTSPALSWQTVSNWFKNRRRQDRRKGVMAPVNAEILEHVN